MSLLHTALEALDSGVDKALVDLREHYKGLFEELDRHLAELDYRMAPLPEFNRRELLKARCEVLTVRAKFAAEQEEAISSIEEKREKVRAEIVGKYKEVFGERSAPRPAAMAN